MLLSGSTKQEVLFPRAMRHTQPAKWSKISCEGHSLRTQRDTTSQWLQSAPSALTYSFHYKENLLILLSREKQCTRVNFQVWWLSLVKSDVKSGLVQVFSYADGQYPKNQAIMVEYNVTCVFLHASYSLRFARVFYWCMGTDSLSARWRMLLLRLNEWRRAFYRSTESIVLCWRSVAKALSHSKLWFLSGVLVSNGSSRIHYSIPNEPSFQTVLDKPSFCWAVYTTLHPLAAIINKKSVLQFLELPHYLLASHPKQAARSS